MRLNPDVLGFIGVFPGINRDGYLLLSGQPDAFTNVGSRAPFTRLHLIDPETGSTNPLVYAQQIGFRPWQKNGVTFTGNSDQSYIGHKYGSLNDNTDFVIQWSDNPDSSPWGTDRMKFVFTTQFNAGAPKGAATTDGLEAMRFWPKNNTEVNVGIGDFAPAIVGDPTERVDVLDGRVRVRQLPDDNEANAEYKVMVVDDSSSPTERGVVKWKDIGDLACGSGWTLENDNPVTAYNGNPCPPQEENLVGIGTSTPQGKLDVLVTGACAVSTAVNVTMNTDAAYKTGVAVDINTTGDQTVGYLAKLSGATNCTGVQSSVGAGSSSGRIIAGEFRANGGGITTMNNLIGVFGSSANGANNGGWAFWAEGKTFSTTSATWHTSDANLKRDIEELDRNSALEGLLQIPLKTFSYNTEEYGFMGMEDGLNRGLLAQDLETIFPDLVLDMHRPGRVSDEGEQIEPDVDFKAVNMNGLLPIMIASIQEQQTTIDELRSMITDCCAAQSRMAPLSGGHSAAPTDGMLQEQRLLIIPNPVADLTRLEYYVPQAGKVSLTVSNNDGKLLATLREEMAQEGAHNYSWNTTDLAAGTYFCTYMLDGAVVVKRAVKVK